MDKYARPPRKFLKYTYAFLNTKVKNVDESRKNWTKVCKQNAFIGAVVIVQCLDESICITESNQNTCGLPFISNSFPIYGIITG